MDRIFSSVRGLVLRSVRYKDADCVLTVLTDKMGLITVKARGAARKNSALSAASQLFSCSDMVLFENAGRFSLNEAHIIEQFEKLRTDIKNMALASYFADVLSSGEEGEQDGGEMMRLALNSLFALCAGYPSLAVKAVFELKYAALSGYMPGLDICAVCGEEAEDGTADPQSGELICSKCGGKKGFYLDTAALCAARHILSCDIKKMLSFSCSAAEIKALSDFAERFLKNCLERGFKTLDYYYALGEYI